MEVVVPDLGDFADVEIIEILVKPGDRVTREQGLVTLETEKATMDIPSPAAGRVGELKVKVGDRVSTGSVLLSLETDDRAQTGPATAADAGTGDRTSADPGNAARAATGAVATEMRAAAAAGAEPAAGATARIVTVPDLGDFAGVEIIEVLVQPGERVAAEQGLVTLETEKASMEVPAPEAGDIVELKVKTGDRVSTGDPLLVLRPVAAAARAEPPPPASAAPPPSISRAPQAAPVARRPPVVPVTGFGEAHASPSVRKLARELGVELGRVRGSGRKGRITADDLKSFVKDVMLGGPAAPALPQVPVVDFAKFGEVSVEPLTRIQKISGPRLHASWINVPHVTQHDEADITDLEERRAALRDHAQQRGIKLTPLAFVIRACVLALAEMPHFKSSLSSDGQSLVVKHYTHIGFAADTPNGLVVPVIRDADKKDIYELAVALAALSEKARAGKLAADDIQGGVFSVSSLGGIGGRYFTPIINAPEVAILGVSRSRWQPVYRGAAFVPRLMLPLSLSYDHRVIDGAKAARFTTRLGEILADAAALTEAIP